MRSFSNLNSMSGLPPAAPSLRIPKRSKSSSLKRPQSCEVGDYKKEGKGLFAKLRKGSSNSRINEDFADDNSSNYPSTDAEIAVLGGRIQGRDFDSDDDDYELASDETVVTRDQKLFSDRHKVINNPALIGELLKYLMNHNQEYFGLLYYFVVKQYKSLCYAKEFSKEAPRYVNEIFTTFLHERSILKIDIDVDVASILDSLKNNQDLSFVFDKSYNLVFQQCVCKSIEKIQTSIAHGLSSIDFPMENSSFDAKINYFNEVIKWVINYLEGKHSTESSAVNATQENREKEMYWSDVISGVKSSLATIYCYFVKKEKDDTIETMSSASNRYGKMGGILGKSSESLQVMSNFHLDKQPLFCSKVHKKPSTHSFFKSKKTIKGHAFQDKNFEYPTECLCCMKLLWGVSPQGLFCTNCQGSVHRQCKDFLRVICQKDNSRRYNRNVSNPMQATEDELGVSKSGATEQNPQVSSNDSKNNLHEYPDTEYVSNTNNSNDQMFMSLDHVQLNENNGVMNMSITSVSSDVSQNQKQSNCISTASIVVSNNDDLISPANVDIEVAEVTEPMTNERIIHDPSEDSFKSSNFSLDSKSHVKFMADSYTQKFIPRSQSDDSVENKTIPRANKRISESVHCQELLSDTNIWSNDVDMNVEETFEADKELEAFPKHPRKNVKKAEYTRLLVLMEFYHKIKFTVMTLKRFEYMLIKVWPEETFLFGTLSLNCIVPLYKLIKTLVSIIEQCKTEETFSKEIAPMVLNWLTENHGTNLQQWLLLSIDLCCTNSLNLVKATIVECRKSDPKFQIVLSRRYNKMVMVEQLSNMRPLLFNLPLIISKIERDLSKYSDYKEESKTWHLIYNKFKLLPTYIDEHCMPLVQLINSGNIVNSQERMQWSSKLPSNEEFYNYIIDFPKTAFHYKVFDHKEIKISNFRESGRKDKTPAVFVKDTSDAIAICYENMLVFLQKENDRYYLKQFKAINDMSKINPILKMDKIHASKGEGKGGKFELTLVFINVAVLAQILFEKKGDVEKWCDFIYQIKSKYEDNIKLKSDQNVQFDRNKSMDVGEGEDDKESILKENNEDVEKDQKKILLMEKLAEMKKSFSDFLTSFNADSLKDCCGQQYTVFDNPTNFQECIIGTICDTLDIMKICNDAIQYDNEITPPYQQLDDDTLSSIILHSSNIANRINICKNNVTNELPNGDDTSNDEHMNAPDEELPNAEKKTESESESKTADQPGVVRVNSECEDIMEFASTLVNQVIATAQSELRTSFDSDRESDDLSGSDNSFPVVRQQSSTNTTCDVST